MCMVVLTKQVLNTPMTHYRATEVFPAARPTHVDQHNSIGLFTALSIRVLDPKRTGPFHYCHCGLSSSVEAVPPGSVLFTVTVDSV
jgi:hypothetical protein